MLKAGNKMGKQLTFEVKNLTTGEVERKKASNKMHIQRALGRRAAIFKVTLANN